MKNINVLDLFCGAGGFSEGFRQAGFNIIAGIDNDQLALETYKNNFANSLALNIDLAKVDADNLKALSLLTKNKIDVIIGGPPCQGFSIAGKRLKDDPRNTLYKAYLDIIKTHNPKAIVLENVPTILSLHGGHIAKQIEQDFNNLGYKTSVFTLTASDYGVPQKRKRTFFVALKKNILMPIPTPVTPNKPITTHEALSDLPLLENESGCEILTYSSPTKNNYQKYARDKSKYIYNHCAVIHTEKTRNIIKLVPDGGNYKDLPANLRNTRRVNIAWTRMNSKKPCFTIDAGHNHHFHYKANRVPTVRECARIQSFPDKFRFYGTRTSQYRQVGNAVPPLVAKLIAINLKEKLLDI